MSREEEFVKKLEERFGRRVRDPRIQRARRIFVEIDGKDLREVLTYVKNELGFDHISAITGLDVGEDIELIYHVAYENSIELSIKTKVSKKDPRIDTVADIYDPAGIYEREVHDLLGVVFEGNPDLSPLLLPDDWPSGVYPLRKDKSFEELRELVEKSGVSGK
ncbi:MAG: NADH-quinone oxidoreductase subunit C [Thaumarchaeota archaeon]|nr:NADH-quinone oxidoreductase subunit C [Nitrososphaerota archaeon]